MPNVRLLIPALPLKAQALAFKQSFYENGEKTINGSYKLDNDRYTYEDWADLMECNRHEETANPEFGVSDTYFAANDEGEIIGIITLRYTLTDFYKDSGHIGYSVAPQHRQQGYATEMLRLALILCRQKGLCEVKLVCAADNVASRKTILGNGGELNRIILKDSGCCAEYVVALK